MKTHSFFRFAWLLAIACAVTLAQAQHSQTGMLEGLKTIPLAPTSANLPILSGALSWELLSKVSTKPSGNRLVPHFPLDIMRLQAKEVKLVGYMMPLSPGQKQTHFLVSYSPSTCNFCLPAGPEGVVEVKSKEGIKISYEPVKLKGQFSVLHSSDNGMYYQLTQASLIP